MNFRDRLVRMKGKWITVMLEHNVPLKGTLVAVFADCITMNDDHTTFYLKIDAVVACYESEKYCIVEKDE